MKNNSYILSSRCSLKFINGIKINKLKIILQEYNKTCNFYISILWNRFLNKEDIPNKFNSIDYLLSNSILSSRMKNSCINHASSIVRSRIEQIKEFQINFKDTKQNNQKLKKLFIVPKLNKFCCILDSKNCIININPDTKHFDLSVTLICLGIFKEKINLLIKKHKHFNQLSTQGKLLNGIILTQHSITFNFEIQKEINNEIKNLGIDIGITNLLTISNGNQLSVNDKGKPYNQILKELSNKKKGSKTFQRKVEERNNCINYCINKLNLLKIQSIIIENIYQLRFKKQINRYICHIGITIIFLIV